MSALSGYVSYPRFFCARNGGPEEAPPVSILKNVRQDPGEKAGAVQYDLTLLLRGTARVGTLNQPFHGLGTNHVKHVN